MNLQELIDENITELGYLDITITSIVELRNLIADTEPTNLYKAAMNQYISEFYNGIENILKRICKFNKIPVPHGSDSHINLFNLFVTNGHSTLPVIFTPEIENEFIKIRKFRHFVIHGYSFKIEWSYLKDSVAKIDSIYDIVKHNILNYIETLKT